MRTAIPNRVRSFLEEQAVPYHVIHHRPDYTAQEVAACTHTRGREFAKTVVVAVDSGYALAVIPASARLNLEKLRKAIGAQEIRLAREDEIQRLCPDCEVGAEPPLGNLYGLPVYMADSLLGDREITFNAGTHEDAVRILESDFERVVKPRILDIS